HRERDDVEDVDQIVHGLLARLLLDRLLGLEHAEHAVGDHETADHVQGAEDQGDEQDDLDADGRVLHLAQRHQRAEHDDAVDGVGARHQRGVQGVGHLGDDGETDEPGQHQDRDVGQQFGIHQASTSRVTQESASTWSPKSGASLPSTSISSSSAAMFLAYSSLACSGMVAGRFNGEAMVTSCLTTVCPGSVSSQLPPVSPARSTMTLPGLMPSTAAAVTSRGAGLPGTSAVVMTTSKPLMASSSACCCRAFSSSVSSRA